MDDPLALLRLELATLWVTDERGRLARARTPDLRPAPLVAVATGSRSCVWACSAAVPDDMAAEIDGVLDGEPADGRAADVGWSPSAAERLVGLVGQLGRVGTVARGPSFVVADALTLDGGRDCWLSTESDTQRLSGRMPEDDRRSLVAPWAVAVVDGTVASVCETARSTPHAVEAGVRTYEGHRRRGLAGATTSAWARLVVPRTSFYSTSFDNHASQRVARRLGSRPLGQWWSVYAAVPEPPAVPGVPEAPAAPEGRERSSRGPMAPPGSRFARPWADADEVRRGHRRGCGARHS